MAVTRKKSKRKSLPSKQGDIAVIDIGSNGVRMVVYRPGRKKFERTCEKKAVCRLGRRLASDNPRLDRKGMGLTLKALRKFRRTLRKKKPRKIFAIGTAAMRSVAHTRKGRAFHRKAERALGCKIKIISGRKEAQLAAQGVMSALAKVSGVCGDLGGGSLELASVRRGRVGHTATLALGSLALLDEAKNDPFRAGVLLHQRLNHAAWLPQSRNRTFYAIGGSWRAVSRVMMKKLGQPVRPIHGFTMRAELAKKYATEISRQKPDAFRKMHRKIRYRADSIPIAAATLGEIIDRMQPKRVTFSAFGVREGLLPGQVKA